jgi:protein-S-isoprenylcysteine O-methyltransferase Ste14
MSVPFAVLGGLLFAGSLVFFAVSYTSGFDGLTAWTASNGWRTAAIDIVLFTVFALHHSVFARTPVRRSLERLVPAELERSVYVWIASLLFLAVCVFWQPVPGALWDVSGAAMWLMRGAQALGAALSVISARRLDVLALAGVRQAIHLRPAPAPAGGDDPVLDRGPYGIVRHPIYFGWFLMVWCAPQMNGTRLVFAAISCLYLVLAIPFEERDLRRTFGPSYGRYSERVRWRIVPGVY